MIPTNFFLTKVKILLHFITRHFLTISKPAGGQISTLLHIEAAFIEADSSTHNREGTSPIECIKTGKFKAASIGL